MTNKIALTASMRSNLLSLKNTQSLLDKTQDRLSSGYKVNTAMDNASSYFTAQALNSRANDLSSLLDSIGQAISTLEVADQGITTLQSFVEQAKSVANSARDTSNVASKATTSSVKFDPDNARTDLVTDYVDLLSGPAPKSISGTVQVTADSKLAADLNLNIGRTITFTLGEDSVNISVDPEDTVQSFMNKVTDAFGEDKIKGEIVDGNIKFTTLNNADLKIESDRDTEAHTAKEIDFDAGADIDTLSVFKVKMGDNSTEIALTSAQIDVLNGYDESDAGEAAEAAAKAADFFNIQFAAAGYNGVAEVSGTTVTFKDMNEGATTGLVITMTATSGAPSPADGAVYNVGLTGTSNAELLGFSGGEASALTSSAKGVAEAGNSFSIRLGDATKMVGTANLRADKTLEDMGMEDGQSIDIIVGDKVHTYTVGKEIDKTSTMQDFMDHIVYDIGRTKIKAELVDGSLTISTLDNSSLAIRSTQATEDHKAAVLAADDLIPDLNADAAMTQITITPSADGATPINIAVSLDYDHSDPENNTVTVENIAEAINNNADAKAAGIRAEINSAGNLSVYDATMGTADNDAPTVAFTGTNVAATALDEGSKTFEKKGSSFNELVGFQGSQTVEVTRDMTVEQFRQAINNLDGISADFDTKGHLVISGEQGDDLVMVNDAGSNVLKNLFGDDVVSATNGSNERAKYAAQFDNILTQIDELVQDTSYKGINLLKGDNLLVNFNESRTSSLDIKGVTFDSVGLGFTRSANEWISNADIDNALNQISKATSLLRAQASEFGQNMSTVQIREDFTQNMINNLQSGADKLTLADMNEEAANMLALQTRQQLGVNSLSLASQASQSVLRLF